MSKLILLRHGQSMWNQKNLFTGWVDVPLTAKGIEEALEAGKQIADIPIDLIFVSTLSRAQMTAMLAMSQHHSGKTPLFQHESGKMKDWTVVHDPKVLAECIPVYAAWELNERMYGELQGLNKDEGRRRFGEEQVHIWRRSYDVPPPQGESLEMTAKRTLPYFEKMVVPHLQAGKNILISAHGNSLRSIVMKLDNLSKEQVLALEIGTGEPIVYTYTHGQYKKHA